MKYRSQFNRYTPIGIDINSRSIYAIQLKRHRSQWHVAHKVHLFRDEHQKLLQISESQRLSDILALAGFVGKQVVASVPNQSLLYGLLELNTANTSDISQAVAKEFSQMHGLHEQPFEMAAWALPQHNSTKQHKIELLTTGCTHDTAYHLMDVLEQAGFDLLAIQPRSTAIAQWLYQHTQSNHATDQQKDALHAAIVCDWDETSLCLIHQNQLVYQSRTYAMSIGKLVQKITQDDNHTQQQIFNALNGTTSQLKKRPVWQLLKQTIEQHWLEQANALRQDMIRCSRYAKQRFAHIQLHSIWPVGIGCHQMDWQTLLDHSCKSPSSTQTNNVTSRNTSDLPTIQPCTPLHAYAAALGLVCHNRTVAFPDHVPSFDNPQLIKSPITGDASSTHATVGQESHQTCSKDFRSAA